MRQFYKTLNKLSKLYSDYPVYVYITTSEILPKCYGDCNFTGKSFSIRIVKGDWHVMKYTLIHEFAHILAWFDKDQNIHGDAWGIAYAKCWRAYTGEDIN